MISAPIPYADLQLAVRRPHDLLWSEKAITIYPLHTEAISLGSGVYKDEDGTYVFVTKVSVRWQLVPANAVIESFTGMWPSGTVFSLDHVLHGVPTTTAGATDVSLRYRKPDNETLYVFDIHYILLEASRNPDRPLHSNPIYRCSISESFLIS